MPMRLTRIPRRQPVVLILEPARELAEQTHAAVDSFLKYLPPPKVETVLLLGMHPITHFTSSQSPFDITSLTHAYTHARTQSAG